MLAIVTETVDAHRLQKMIDLLAFEKLAIWRRIDGFNRVADGEENWFHGHCSLPLTPEEYAASLRSDLQELKNEISMPTETRPWQKAMDFVDDSKENSRMRNLRWLSGTWKSGVARRHRRR